MLNRRIQRQEAILKALILGLPALLTGLSTAQFNTSKSHQGIAKTGATMGAMDAERLYALEFS